MTNKDVIAWQFAEDYYKYLIKKISVIDTLIIYGAYEESLEQLKQILAQIGNPIKKELPEMYDKLFNLSQELDALVFDYNGLLIRENPPRPLLMKITRLKHNLKIKLYAFYTDIMSTIDNLNMLFPRQKKDDRLAIYKS